MNPFFNHPEQLKMAAQFVEDYKQVLNRVLSLFEERQAEGYNAEMPVVGMFPEGRRDIAFEVWNKATRVRGALKVGNHKKAVAEMEDIINYAAFFIAFPEEEDGNNPDPAHTRVEPLHGRRSDASGASALITDGSGVSEVLQNYSAQEIRAAADYLRQWRLREGSLDRN